MQKYFIDLWNGNKSLLQTFWIWNALSWAVINNLSGYIFDAYATPENFKILAWALMLTQIIYFVFAAKCLWACGVKINQNAFGWAKIWYPLIILYIGICILFLSRALLLNGYI